MNSTLLLIFFLLVATAFASNIRYSAPHPIREWEEKEEKKEELLRGIRYERAIREWMLEFQRANRNAQGLSMTSFLLCEQTSKQLKEALNRYWKRIRGTDLKAAVEQRIENVVKSIEVLDHLAIAVDSDQVEPFEFEQLLVYNWHYSMASSNIKYVLWKLIDARRTWPQRNESILDTLTPRMIQLDFPPIESGLFQFGRMFDLRAAFDQRITYLESLLKQLLNEIIDVPRLRKYSFEAERSRPIQRAYPFAAGGKEKLGQIFERIERELTQMKRELEGATDDALKDVIKRIQPHRVSALFNDLPELNEIDLGELDSNNCLEIAKLYRQIVLTSIKRILVKYIPEYIGENMGRSYAAQDGAVFAVKFMKLFHPDEPQITIHDILEV